MNNKILKSIKYFENFIEEHSFYHSAIEIDCHYDGTRIEQEFKDHIAMLKSLLAYSAPIKYSHWRCVGCGNTNDDARSFLWQGNTPTTCNECGYDTIQWIMINNKGKDEAKN